MSMHGPQADIESFLLVFSKAGETGILFRLENLTSVLELLIHGSENCVRFLHSHSNCTIEFEVAF